MKGNHDDDPVLCKHCGADAMEPASEQFAFLVARKKDGTVLDRAFKGVILLVRCNACGKDSALIDSPKDDAHWNSLKRWEER